MFFLPESLLKTKCFGTILEILYHFKVPLTCSATHAHFGGLGHRGDGVRDHS